MVRQKRSVAGAGYGLKIMAGQRGAPSNSSQCRTQVVEKTTAVESESTCANPVSVIPGDRLNCVVSNSVFFEGIPTLSHLGLLLFSSLMLLTGLWSVRRF